MSALPVIGAALRFMSGRTSVDGLRAAAAVFPVMADTAVRVAGVGLLLAPGLLMSRPNPMGNVGVRWLVVLPLFVGAVFGLEWVVGRAAYSGHDVPPILAIVALVVLFWLAALGIIGKAPQGRSGWQTALRWIPTMAFFGFLGFVCTIRT